MCIFYFGGHFKYGIDFLKTLFKKFCHTSRECQSYSCVQIHPWISFYFTDYGIVLFLKIEVLTMNQIETPLVIEINLNLEEVYKPEKKKKPRNTSGIKCREKHNIFKLQEQMKWINLNQMWQDLRMTTRMNTKSSKNKDKVSTTASNF